MGLSASVPSQRRLFRALLWPTVFALAGVTVLVAIGFWQLDRRAQKRALINRIEAGASSPSAPLPAIITNPAALEFGHFVVAGQFLHDLEVLLLGRTHGGKLGYHLATPLKRESGPPVMVDRGWIPVEQRDPQSRPLTRRPGWVALQGIARVPREPGWFAPANRPEVNEWFWLDLPTIAQQQGLPELAPVVIEAIATNRPGDPIGRPPTIQLPNNHLQYALTWFGLAGALGGVYVAFVWRQRAPRENMAESER